jgi:hypothetical protein
MCYKHLYKADLTNDLLTNKKVDIKFSAHDAFLE